MKLLLFAIAFAVLIAWTFLGIIIPTKRAISNGHRIKFYSAFFLMGIPIVAIGLAFDFEPHGTFDVRVYSLGDIALKNLLVLAGVPIAFLLALYETVTLFWEGQFRIFCAVFLVGLLLIWVGACRLQPVQGVWATLLLPPILLVLASSLQAQLTDKKVAAAIVEIAPDCAVHTPFAAYFWSPKHNRFSFHTYIRKDSNYFNWSYRQDRFVPIPNSRISNASKCHKRL